MVGRIRRNALLLGISLWAWSTVSWAQKNYFCDTYAECRKKFKENVNAFQEKHKATVDVNFYRAPLPGSKYEIDYASIYPLGKERPSSLVIVTSGVHGIEGFAGSAVQSLFLDQIYSEIKHNKDLGVVLIHGINPYGFENMRRVDEANVDLNRNFDAYGNGEIYQSKNEAYEKLNRFLNPSKPVGNLTWQKITFDSSAGVRALWNGKKSMRDSILFGQYEFPKGIYFGGKEPRPQVKIIDLILNTYVKNKAAKKVLILDLHTGYGKKNQMHIFSELAFDDRKNKSVTELMNTTFHKYGFEKESDKNNYEIKGGMATYLGYKSQHFDDGVARLAVPVSVEFGTMDSDKILGGVESLRRMVLENQLFHNPYKGRDAKTLAIASAVQKMYKDMFYPSDEEWRRLVLNQARDNFPKFIDQFVSGKKSGGFWGK